MSQLRAAETALVSKLEESRSRTHAIQASKPKYVKLDERSDSESTTKKWKVAKADEGGDDDARAVLNLEVPRFDNTRKFEGIERQKIAKKDRHNKALEDFGKTLDKVADSIEKSVLQLSRDVREDIEDLDQKIQTKYNSLKEDGYLVVKSSEELEQDLQFLKDITLDRSKLVEKFASDLEAIECQRADSVGEKIRQLVDLLVSIAHQLPDEIEHTVEAETFDLNAVVTANRNSHAELLGIMRKKQVEIEILALHNWDVAKQQWRLLKHNQCIEIFHEDISSTEYTAPSDRQAFMNNVRKEQQERHEARQSLLKQLKEFTADSISSDKVTEIKESLGQLNEQELAATVHCYHGLSSLRASLRFMAENRMEMLRKELHKYGALHPEPELHKLSDSLKDILSDQNMAETFRLGGALKPELSSVAADFVSEDIVYDSLVSAIESRLDVISSGFGLKEVMNERGRLPRLDTIRSMLTKLRSVPRAEVVGVLSSLLPDLREMSGYDKMPATFLSIVGECADSIESELSRVQENIDKGLGDDNRTTIPQSTSRGGSRGDTRVTAKENNSQVNSRAKSSTKRTMTGRQTATTRNVVPEHIQLTTADPVLVKNWTRQLSMLFYGCEIPENYRSVIMNCLKAVSEARTCNTRVDAVVFSECDKVLNQIDQKYKALIDLISNFLEVQAQALSHTTIKIADFFGNIAKVMEDHKSKQAKLDEASLDLMWDFSEENRFACEDREAEYEALCSALRKSADMDELKSNFDAILAQLAKILEGYRAYHGQACFLADKHPLSLVDDYTDHMKLLCGIFEMEPVEPHLILEMQTKLHNENIRFNQKYLSPSKVPSSHDELEASHKLGDEEEDNREDVEKGETVERVNSSSVVSNASQSKDEDDNILDLSKKKTPSPRPEQYGEIFTLAVPTTRPRNVTIGPESESDHVEESIHESSCQYGIRDSFETFVKVFLEDSSANNEEEEEEEVANLVNVPDSEETPSDDENDGDKKQDRYNEEYPWLVIRSYEPNAESMDMITLLDEEQVEEMGEYDKIMYEESIAKHFVPREEESFEVHRDATKESEEEFNERKSKADALAAAYAKTLDIVERCKQRKIDNSSPDYLIDKIPKDSSGESFVCRVQVGFSDVSSLLGGIRESVLSHLESNCCKRVIEATELNRKRKNELTEQLEDLLRTHWPRCGLVETQIKRPREVELLNHEEKTYRFILSIQEKMTNLQSSFDDTVEGTKKVCDDFRDELNQLLKSLTETQHKTLAALQGVEVKARSITQSFNNTGNGLLTTMRQMVAEDASSIIIYARDFRKICPPQEEGVSGGYSEAELEDIGKLVEGQCAEIMEVQEEWKEIINELDQRISEEALKHNDFTDMFEQVSNELALSQGLGQKFGAPRRRAQEKLRTEMSRDEKSAGQVDELLAMLEFQCAEAISKCENRQEGQSLISVLLQGRELSVSTKALHRVCGFDELQAVENMWSLAVHIRDSLHTRAKYLDVFAEGATCSTNDIYWPPVFSRLPDPPEDLKRPKLHKIVECPCLAAVVEEVEGLCRSETQDLYKQEGKEEILAETEEGIPESLSVWLKETHEKIMGPKGHHEKSWKRLWGQVDKFEYLLARKPGPMDQPQIREGVPAACFRLLSVGYQEYISLFIDQKVEEFAKLLKVWEKGKIKHERQLRPRLGSPDARQELEQLDAIESQRTEEVRINVEKFQSSLITFLVMFSKTFCNDLGDCAKSFFHLLDSSLRLDFLQVPPDTEVPKKKVTLKRLRKAQRIKAEVEKGNEDVSVERVWPALSTEKLVLSLRNAEKFVVQADLLRLNPPPPVTEAAEVSSPKKKMTAKKSQKAVEEPEEETVQPPAPPPLVAEDWIHEINKNSAVRAAVSSGHRLLVSERDAALEKLVDHVDSSVGENILYYGRILQQEESWCERWHSQVQMLKSGNM